LIELIKLATYNRRMRGRLKGGDRNKRVSGLSKRVVMHEQTHDDRRLEVSRCHIAPIADTTRPPHPHRASSIHCTCLLL
jgi:hypothetical protein